MRYRTSIYATAIEHYQYEAKLTKVGAPEVGQLVEMAHRLVMLGFSPQQELEADAQGERLSVQAGYDPDAEAELFTRMKARFQEPSRVPADTPAGEITEAAGEAIGVVFPYASAVRRAGCAIE